MAERIGFIGLGIMGHSMAANLLKAGHDLTVWNRTASRADDLVDQGANVGMKTKLGWTPLMVAEGVFFANAKKEYPQAAAILRKAVAEKPAKP